ncbi:MAG: hypothetical protein J0L65_16710, partial [Xanthomonadales bacterium]|nr:hypothetical protein [Xanthomonadales bacterium]
MRALPRHRLNDKFSINELRTFAHAHQAEMSGLGEFRQLIGHDKADAVIMNCQRYASQTKVQGNADCLSMRVAER